MQNENSLDIGSLKDAKEKTKQTFNKFVDLIAKFLTLADYYSQREHYYQPLDETMVNDYTRYSNLLLKSSPEDFCYEISKECLLYLEFIDEIKENLINYNNVMNDAFEKGSSDYDKICDTLTVKDEFIDLMEPINDAYNIISKTKIVEPHFDDPLYDISTVELQKRQNS